MCGLEEGATGAFLETTDVGSQEPDGDSLARRDDGARARPGAVDSILIRRRLGTEVLAAAARRWSAAAHNAGLVESI